MERAWIGFSLLAGCAEPAFAGRVEALGSDALVIAEVHAGGGNVGAAYDRDYVVVLNRGASAVSLAETSLQYASGSGTSRLGATDATRTPLPDRLLAPGQALLVAGAGGTSGAPLPSSDVVDATPLALATSGGRLALVRGVEPLACNGASSPCDAAASARVIDLVGWGNAAWAEGAVEPSPTGASALTRRGAGCVDTDVNADDFEAAPPSPRSSGDPFVPCVAAVDASVAGDGGSDTGVAPLVDASLPPPLHVPADVQGSLHRSPLEGMRVERVRGVVTWSSGRRFAMELEGATDASNGIFVLCPGAAPVSLGRLVEVDGVVRELRPECASCGEGSEAFANFTTTTIEADAIVVLGMGALPAPATIDPQSQADAIGPYPSPLDLERASALSPESQAIDALERREGMRVRLASPHALGPTRAYGGRRELWVGWDEAQVSPWGAGLDPGPGALGARIALVDEAGPSLPWLDAGDRFVGDVVGVVDYERGRFVLRVGAWQSASHRPAMPERMPPIGADELRIASFNVHGLAATSDAAAFASIAQIVVDALASPDLLVLQEIADDSGASDDGTTSAERTRARLADAILAKGGPRYRTYDQPPVDGADGGEPGANVRVAFFAREDRELRLVESGGPMDADARLERGALRPSPGRIAREEPAFVGSRKPLVALFEHRGRSLVVVGVHFRSHLGDAPRLGRFQPPERPSDEPRRAQAAFVARFVEALRRADPALGIAVVGDFNDGYASPALEPLRATELVDALASVPPELRGSYVYEGRSADLDQVLLSPGLDARRTDARVLHVAAGFADGASDHDPIVVALGPAVSGPPASGCAIVLPPRARSRTWFLAAVLALAALRRAARRCP